MAIALLQKPKFRTTSTVEAFHTYEVTLFGEGQDPTFGGQMNPRPAMGFDRNDAVAKLAAMLKLNHLTPDDFLTQMADYKLGIVLAKVTNLEEGAATSPIRVEAAVPHEAIVTMLHAIYPEVNPAELAGVEQRLKPVSINAEDTARMQTYTNSANQQTEAPRRQSPLNSLPKERKIITVNQGGGDQRESLQELAKQLTPESIPAGGLVIVSGKNGPKVLKAASARIDEEDAARDMETLEAGGEVSLPRATSAQVEIPLAAPVAKAASEAPRPAPKVRTLTDDQLAAQASSVDISHRATILDQGGFETTMDTEDAAALADQQMGTTGMALPSVDMRAAISATVRDADQHTQLGEEVEVGGRSIKKSTVIRHDRGGTRPTTLTR